MSVCEAVKCVSRQRCFCCRYRNQYGLDSKAAGLASVCVCVLGAGGGNMCVCDLKYAYFVCILYRFFPTISYINFFYAFSFLIYWLCWVFVAP